MFYMPTVRVEFVIESFKKGRCHLSGTYRLFHTDTDIFILNWGSFQDKSYCESNIRPSQPQVSFSVHYQL